MIEWLVELSLRKRLVVVMICIFAACYGYYSWTRLAIEAYPDIRFITELRYLDKPHLTMVSGIPASARSSAYGRWRQRPASSC